MSRKATRVSLCIVLITVFTVTGCASIVSKTNYPITISSTPEKANITIINKKGKEVYQGTTPTTLTLTSRGGFFSGEKYTITFSREDFETQTTELSSELDPWYIGNIIFGGLIGLLIVDPATGAMWKLPPEVNVDLVQESQAIRFKNDELSIACIEDVPQIVRDGLIRIR